MARRRILCKHILDTALTLFTSAGLLSVAYASENLAEGPALLLALSQAMGTPGRTLSSAPICRKLLDWCLDR